jgi:hypothetical protein
LVEGSGNKKRLRVSEITAKQICVTNVRLEKNFYCNLRNIYGDLLPLIVEEPVLHLSGSSGAL